MPKNNKRILLFSYNPVPTTEYKTVEGSALRTWNIAKALHAKGYEDITIAIWTAFPQTLKQFESIKLANYTADEQEFKTLTQDADAIIVNAALGDIPRRLFMNAPSTTTIIIDALSPMYVEHLTNSTDSHEDRLLRQWYFLNTHMMNEALVKSDYILVANEHQKHLYRGVLAGLGALFEYDDAQFVTLPAFHIKDTVINEAKTSRQDKINVLWFGGLYPWYDIGDLISAFAQEQISRMATLTIVGGSNPFYPKDNMRFNGKYINACRQADKLGLTKRGVVTFKDWVPYADRLKEFSACDIAITVNSSSIENAYSFRLGVADLVGHGVPIITNGGDYIGDVLAKEGVAFTIDTSSPENLRRSLIKVLEDKEAIQTARRRLLTELHDMVHLEGYIQNLVDCIESSRLRRDNARPTTPYLEAIATIERIKAGNPLSPLNREGNTMLDFHGIPTRTMVKITARRVVSGVAAKVRKALKKRHP